jgi:hypothetical protein
MSNQDQKSQDEKKAQEKAQPPAAETTPRPDPVGERNYAMSQPIVRPEGEGTPGAMRQTLPPVATTPEPSQPVRPDAERHATSAATPTPVGPEAHRRTVAPPVVPVKPPPAKK